MPPLLQPSAEGRNRPAGGGWWIVVPLKAGAEAKSRLAPDPRLGGDPRLRAMFARTFFTDTVVALRASPRVAGVVTVVGDRSGIPAAEAAGTVVVVQPTGTAGDLNAALRAGIAAIHVDHPGVPVAIALGDLPALRSHSATVALDLAGRLGGTVFVADAEGSGTTLLARSGGAPEPRFGWGSAAAHRASGAVEISALVPADLRLDVDTTADLDAAVRLGVGRATTDALRALDISGEPVPPGTPRR